MSMMMKMIVASYSNDDYGSGGDEMRNDGDNDNRSQDDRDNNNDFFT